MGRRRQLHGIVSNLARSFASRNNDVGGYWALGRLYKLAIDTGTRELTVELIHRTATDPSETLIEAVRAHCATKLAQHLARHSLADAVIASANVLFSFEIPFDRLRPYENYGYGQPFECRVEIVDDLGHRYSARSGGKVAPFEPCMAQGPFFRADST